MEKRNLTQQEIIEATMQGTIKGISKFIFYLIIFVLTALGLLYLFGFLIDNHNEYKFCRFNMEENEFTNSRDYVCKYFGEKNDLEVWEKSLIERKVEVSTLTIYVRDKMEVSNSPQA